MSDKIARKVFKMKEMKEDKEQEKELRSITVYISQELREDPLLGATNWLKHGFIWFAAYQILSTPPFKACLHMPIAY